MGHGNGGEPTDTLHALCQRSRAYSIGSGKRICGRRENLSRGGRPGFGFMPPNNYPNPEPDWAQGPISCISRGPWQYREAGLTGHCDNGVVGGFALEVGVEEQRAVAAAPRLGLYPTRQVLTIDPRYPARSPEPVREIRDRTYSSIVFPSPPIPRLHFRPHQILTRALGSRYRRCPGCTSKASYQASRLRTVEIR